MTAARTPLELAWRRCLAINCDVHHTGWRKSCMAVSARRECSGSRLDMRITGDPGRRLLSQACAIRWNLRRSGGTERAATRRAARSASRHLPALANTAAMHDEAIVMSLQNNTASRCVVRHISELGMSYFQRTAPALLAVAVRWKQAGSSRESSAEPEHGRARTTLCWCAHSRSPGEGEPRLVERRCRTWNRRGVLHSRLAPPVDRQTARAGP
jgi:hypothetical protein